MVLVLCAISSAAWFQVGNKESADVKEAFKRCRSSFWAKDITRPIELHFGAILRLRKWLEIHHSIISFFVCESRLRISRSLVTSLPNALHIIISFFISLAPFPADAIFQCCVWSRASVNSLSDTLAHCFQPIIRTFHACETSWKHQFGSTESYNLKFIAARYSL